MAQITLTIPDAVLPRVVAAFASRYNYDKNKLDANETQGQFARRMLGQVLKEITVGEEARAAANTAFDNANASGNTTITVS